MVFCLLTAACSTHSPDPSVPSADTHESTNRASAKQLLPAFENRIAETLFRKLDDELNHRVKLGRNSEQVISTHWLNIKRSVDPDLLSYENALIWRHLQSLNTTGPDGSLDNDQSPSDDMFDDLTSMLPEETASPRGYELIPTSNVAKQLYLSALNDGLISMLPRAKQILTTKINTLPPLSIALQTPDAIGDHYDVVSATAFFDLTSTPRRDLTQAPSEIVFHGVPGAHLMGHQMRWRGIQDTEDTRAHRRGWSLYITDHMMRNRQPTQSVNGYLRFLRRQVLLAMIDHGYLYQSWSANDANRFLESQGVEPDEAKYLIAVTREHPGRYLDTMRGYRDIMRLERMVQKEYGDRFEMTDFMHSLVSYGPLSMSAVEWLLEESFPSLPPKEDK